MTVTFIFQYLLFFTSRILLCYVPICGPARLQGLQGQSIFHISCLSFCRAYHICDSPVPDRKQWSTSFALVANCGTYDYTGISLRLFESTWKIKQLGRVSDNQDFPEFDFFKDAKE